MLETPSRGIPRVVYTFETSKQQYISSGVGGMSLARVSIHIGKYTRNRSDIKIIINILNWKKDIGEQQ